MTAFNWLAAWALFIFIIIAIAQTKAGNTIAYYLLWLAVIFLLVSHYQEINDIFKAGGIVPQSQA